METRGTTLDNYTLGAILEALYFLIYAVFNYLNVALLLKAIFRNHFCFTAYVIAQIIILLEEIYLIGVYELLTPPSIFTKLPGAILFFIFTIIVTKFILKSIKVPHTWFAIIFGSSFGTLGIFIIGSLHVKQMQPFYPISHKNPLFGIIEDSWISNFLFFSLLLSVGIFTFRRLKLFFFSKNRTSKVFE